MRVRRAFVIFSAVLFLFSLGANSAYSEPIITSEPVLQGYLDSFVVDGEKFNAQGWVGVTKPGSKATSISIWLADTLVYDGHFERFERSDVVKATGRGDWLVSGWRINSKLPEGLKNGEYPVKVLVTLDNGQAGPLGIIGQFEQIYFTEGLYQSSRIHIIWIARAALIALFALLCVVYFKADYLADKISFRANCLVQPPVIFGLTLLLSFWGCVGLGITGSSFNFGIQQTPFVQSEVINIAGGERPVRSDEWLVFTPLAIAQYNHLPQFPVANKNLGEDGQNMLVVGMAGVPVTHISLIAKPATWGFFLFDLKRALSWYWLFPIFACLFALWGVVALLSPGDWKSSFLIALWFGVSPYVAAWSNWPAYAVFFPSLTLITAIAILRSHNKYLLIALGCILGCTLAGFVLILYPPWQVSLGYVFLALAAGIAVRDKLYKNFNKIRLTAYGIAITVAGIILWQWWSDAHLAIQAMEATVYPGQRRMAVSGDVALPDLLRGFTNIITLNKLDTVYSNQSEIASFYYMLLPLTALFAFRLYQKMIGAVEIALMGMIIFILYLMLAGVPVEVAKFSLWGRVPSGRADIALGLSYIMLCGLLLAFKQETIPNKTPIKTLVFWVAVIWAAIVYSSISRLHASILSGFSPGMFAGLFFVVVIAGYWLALGKFREFIYLNLALSVATILPFNPLNIAPQRVTAMPPIDRYNEKASSHVASQRVLVLETQIPAMLLLASGLPVANGVFYYPQNSLWERLDKEHKKSNTYNRYQHLIFSGGYVESSDNYRIESPQADVVKIIVDLEKFDFRKTGARLITAPQHEEIALRKNAVLIHIKNAKGWAWFQVIGGLNDN